MTSHHLPASLQELKEKAIDYLTARWLCIGALNRDELAAEFCARSEEQKRAGISLQRIDYEGVKRNKDKLYKDRPQNVTLENQRLNEILGKDIAEIKSIVTQDDPIFDDFVPYEAFQKLRAEMATRFSDHELTSSEEADAVLEVSFQNFNPLLDLSNQEHAERKKIRRARNFLENFTTMRLIGMEQLARDYPHGNLIASIKCSKLNYSMMDILYTA